MKQALQGPKQRFAFRGKSRQLIIAVAALLLTFQTQAQTPPNRSQMQRINTYYSYIGAEFRKVLYVPLDTSARDVGAVAFLDNRLLLRVDTGWVDWGLRQVDDSTFIFAYDTFTIRSASHIEQLSDSTYKIGGDTLKYRSLYNTNGSIPGTRNINFQGTGILNMQNMLAIDWSGATGGFQVQANPSWFRLAHFASGNSKQIRMGDLPHEGISLSTGLSSLILDTLYGLKITGLKSSYDPADSMLVYDYSTGQVKYRQIPAAAATPTLQQVATAGNTYTGTLFSSKFEATDVTDNGTPSAAFRINRILRANINASGHGFRDQTNFRRPGYAYNSFDAAPTIDSAGNYDHLIGFQGRPTLNHASAVVKYMYGGAASIPNVLAGLADTLPGFDVSDFVGAGSVTYNIGVRVRPLTKGAFNFAYYSDGTTTPSAFRGSLGLGLGDFVQPTERLDISGNLKVTGNILFNNAGANHDIKPATAVTALPFATQIFGNIAAVSETNGGGLIEVHADDGSPQGGRVNIIPYGRNASPGAGAFVVSTRSGPGTIANRLTVEQYGAVRIGYINNSPHGFSVNRSVSFEKDSLLRRAVAGAWKIVIQDTSSTADSNALALISLSDLSTAIGGGIAAGSEGSLQFKKGTAFSGEQSLTYNDYLKSLQSGNVRAANSFQAGDSTYNSAPADTSIIFGNSIEAGTTIVPSYLRPATQFSNMLNTTEVNYAIGGTTMVQLSAGDSSMEERIFRIPIKTPGKKYLFFAYGTNDVGNLSIDTSEFKTAYNKVIDTAIARGWAAQSIIVVSNGIRTDAVSQRDSLFAAVTGRVAIGKGAVFSDVYTAMAYNGRAKLLQADGVHPTEKGNELIANVVAGSLGAGGNGRFVNNITAGGLHLRQRPNPWNAPVINAYDNTTGLLTLEARFIRRDILNPENLGIGRNGLALLTTGTGNVTIGGNSGAAITTASSCMLLGTGAGASNQTGNGVTAIGQGSVGSSVSVSNLTGVGYRSQANTTAIGGTSLGAFSLENNVTGTNITAIGTESFRANVSGSSLTGTGYQSARRYNGGNFVSVFGYQVADSLLSGTGHTMMGAWSGRTQQSGSYLTYIGYNNALGSRTGSYNTVVGAQYSFPAEYGTAVERTVVLSDGNGSARFFSNSLGRTGIGTEFPTQRLHVGGKARIDSISNSADPDSVLTINEGVVEKTVSPYTRFFSDTTGAIVANTTTQSTILGTGVGSTTVTTRTAGSTIRVRGQGYLSTAATAGVPTFAFSVAGNGINLNLSGLPNSLHNAFYEYSLEVTISGIGSSRVAIYVLKISVSENGQEAKVYSLMSKSTSASIPSSSAAIAATVTWNTADPDNSVTSMSNQIDIIR